MPYYGGWAPYVSVAKRRRRALTKMAQLRKKGMDIRPIEIKGRKIAKTFWGQAWCDHMESLGDFANRLPRGRTYVRNGSVCHLAIKKGQITAMVNGSSLYDIKITIDTLPRKTWNKVKSRSAGQIGSLLELLQGRLSDEVMGVVTDSSSGLFPLSKEIHLSCSCPDWAVMCKHVAAALYGVGARLDQQPNLIFLLRGVKHEELIDADAENALNRATRRGGRRPVIASGDLGEVFGIDLETGSKSKGDSDEGQAPNTSTKKRPHARKKNNNKAVTPHRKKAKTGKQDASTSANKKSISQATKKKVFKEKAAKRKPAKKPTPVKQATIITAQKKAAQKKAAKKKAVKQKVAKKKTVKKKAAKKSTVKKKAVKQKAAKKKGGKKKAAKKKTVKKKAAKKKRVNKKAVKQKAAKKKGVKNRAAKKKRVKKKATKKKATKKNVAKKKAARKKVARKRVAQRS
jgi:uncharacterized Zn finger protein